MFTRTYNPARIIEILIENAVDNVDGVHIWSEPWKNGREKGFRFTGTIPGPYKDLGFVYVAEHRGSDDIAVTFSKFGDWGLLTDDEYKKRINFPRSNYRDAAQMVLVILGVEDAVA